LIRKKKLQEKYDSNFTKKLQLQKGKKNMHGCPREKVGRRGQRVRKQ
jgi:hypothetical protein